MSNDKFYNHPCGIPPHNCQDCEHCEVCEHCDSTTTPVPPTVCGTCGKPLKYGVCPNGHALGNFKNGEKIRKSCEGKFNVVLSYEEIEKEFTGCKKYDVLCYLWNQNQSEGTTIK